MRSNREKRWREAHFRQSIIRPLAFMPLVSVGAIREAAAQLGRQPRTVRNWIKLYRTNPILDTLMPGHKVSPPRKKKLPPETWLIIEQHVKKTYLGRREKVTIKSLYEDIEADCLKANTQVPSVRTIGRHVQDLPEKARAKARKIDKDPRAFEAYPNHHVVQQLLGQVQIDHTQVDEFIDLSEYGLGVRRIWLTLAIDVASRMVFGYYLGLRSPNAHTCGLALMQGILPKKAWVETLDISYSEFANQGIDDPWPIGGIPFELASDNAKEFKSNAYVMGCRCLGINVRYRPLGKPHFGGHIERLIGRFMGEVHFLPGNSSSNVVKKGDYPAEKEAFLTLEDFEQWFVASILEYHLRPHRSLRGQTPLQKFHQLYQQDAGCVRYVPDHCHIRSAFLAEHPRTVSKQGIQFDNCFYWHGRLAELIGSRVVIKVHRARTDTVWVCLDGRTPVFQAKLIGAKGCVQHMDTPRDHIPTLALKQEAKRQEAVAKRLSQQKKAHMRNLYQHRHRVAKPVRATTKHTVIEPILATRPSLKHRHDQR